MGDGRLGAKKVTPFVSMARRSDAVTSAPTTAVPDGRWSPAQAAEYAARRDFLFCQLLVTDRRAFAVARRLRWGPRDARSPDAQSTGATSAAPQSGRQQQQRDAGTARAPNARQRRSRDRAAANRAALANAPAAAPAAAVAAMPLLPQPTPYTSSTPTSTAASAGEQQDERMVDSDAAAGAKRGAAMSPGAVKAITALRAMRPRASSLPRKV